MAKPDPDRLAAALRDNLRRRKAQSREAQPVENPSPRRKPGPQDEDSPR